MSERTNLPNPATVRAMWLSRTEALATRRARAERDRAAALTRGVSVLVAYGRDDYVIPTDLPRAFVCRVVHAHGVPNTSLQVLELDPLDGPWPHGTRLIRGSDSVRPATSSELWDVRTSPRAPLARTVRPRRHAPPLRRVSRLDEARRDL
jgi:hypothetical protein